MGSRFRANQNDIANDYYRYGISSANRTKYTERIWQYYLSADVPIGKSLSLEVGGQMEYSDIGLETDGKSQRSYHDFLPKVTFLRKGEKVQMSLSYYQIMARPSYLKLDPRPHVLSKNVFQRGNPNLSPEIWDVYSANYVTPGIILFADIVSRSNTVVYNDPLVDGNGQTFIVPVNIRERLTSFMAGATVQRGGERWNCSVSNDFFYRSNTPLKVESNLMYRLILQGSLRNIFGSGTAFSFYGSYRTPWQRMNEKENSHVYYFFDFSKSFGHSTTLGLKIEDPFAPFRYETRYTYDGGAFRNEIERPDYRSFSLYFSKKIGSDKVKSAKKLHVGDGRLGY